MDDQTKQAIWEEMFGKEINKTILPHERTSKQLQEQFGLGEWQVRALIKRMLAQGKLKSRSAIVNGKACTAYSFTDIPDEHTKDSSK